MCPLVLHYLLGWRRLNHNFVVPHNDNKSIQFNSAKVYSLAVKT